MNNNLPQIIAKFSLKKVLVLGESILNCDLQGKGNHVCLEATIPVVNVSKINYSLGGAGNMAANLASLVSEIVFVSVIGDDYEGKVFQETLQKKQISIQYLLTDSTRKTLTKQHILNGENLLIRCDWGTTDDLATETEKRLIASLQDLYPICDAILVYDCGDGILTPALIATLTKLQRNTPKIIIVDSLRLELYRQINVTAVKENEREVRDDLEISEQNTSTLSPLSSACSQQEKLVNDRTVLTEVVKQHRQLGQQIVFTNGCFDILHPGHVAYLAQAKALGDILIVGVNSDASIKQLKGSQRPINSLRDRVQVLAALASIDYVVPFEESTPSELLKIVSPEIYVKGGDYTRETLPETPIVEELGGVIKILPFVGSNSTTKIIQKIRNL